MEDSWAPLQRIKDALITDRSNLLYEQNELCKQLDVIKGKLGTLNDLLDKVDVEIDYQKKRRTEMKGAEGTPNDGKVASRRSRP
jgi:hypothetical protein